MVDFNLRMFGIIVEALLPRRQKSQLKILCLSFAFTFEVSLHFYLRGNNQPSFTRCFLTDGHDSPVIEPGLGLERAWLVLAMTGL